MLHYIIVTGAIDLERFGISWFYCASDNQLIIPKPCHCYYSQQQLVAFLFLLLLAANLSMTVTPSILECDITHPI